MPRAQPYARIAITLPADDLAAADQLANRQDRSRSWIIAEAIRRYAAASLVPGEASAVSPPAQRGLGAQRREQLAADLRLSVEDRVRAAEDTARVAELRSRVRAKRVIAFDRFEDYLDWKKFEAAGA